MISHGRYQDLEDIFEALTFSERGYGVEKSLVQLFNSRAVGFRSLCKVIDVAL